MLEGAFFQAFSWDLLMTERRSLCFLEAHLSLTVDRCLEGDIMKGSHLVGFIEDTGVQVPVGLARFQGGRFSGCSLIICQACECVWHLVLGVCKD